MDAFDATGALAALDGSVPTERTVRTLDVRALGPPEPMTETLETLEGLGGDALLLQVNDRAPRYLYPRLTDRGYAYATATVEDATVTAVWEP
jgi:hypothetical protein